MNYGRRAFHSRSRLESAVQIKSAPNAGYTRKKGPISVYYPHQNPEKFINTRRYEVRASIQAILAKAVIDAMSFCLHWGT